MNIEKIGKWLVGTFLSAMGGLLIISIGIILCLTILGGVIGLPMILLGLFMIFLSPIYGAVMEIKQCPFCQSPLILFMGQRTIKCRACKKQIIARGTGKEKIFEVLTT